MSHCRRAPERRGVEETLLTGRGAVTRPETERVRELMAESGSSEREREREETYA